MSTYGLGLDDAAKAFAVSMAVSKSLQRDAVEPDVAMIEAIDDLACRLSVANLFRRDTSPSPVPASTTADVMRIQPMERMLVAPATRNHKTTIPSTASPPTPSSIASRKTKVVSAKNPKHKGPNGPGRKRSADDMNTFIPPDNTKVTTVTEESPKAFTKRERSDSLSEVVNAKFADKKSTVAERLVRIRQNHIGHHFCSNPLQASSSRRYGIREAISHGNQGPLNCHYSVYSLSIQYQTKNSVSYSAVCIE
jgi:hypothetical protein